MATLNLPDDIKAKADALAAEGGFASTDEFVAALIEAEAEAEDLGAPEHLRVRSHEHLVALVREGLASPAREMTSADFTQLRAELTARHVKPKAE